MKNFICKKNYSKCLSVILSLVLVFSMVTLCVPLAGAESTSSDYEDRVYYYSGDYWCYVLDNGTACLSQYYGEEVNLTIPSKIGGYSVTVIDEYSFSSCESLTSVTIPNSVTKIGNGAFWCCESLESITIPGSVTKIGESAFSNCTSLTSVTIANGVKEIGDWAFSSCESLKNITIPNSVTKIGEHAFSSCYSLVSITIPGSVTKIGENAFSYCTSLTSVTIANGVKEIGECAFYECTSLKSITIPGGVTKIGESAFGWCTSLTSVTIANGVKEIGDSAFGDCESLKSITIPNSVTKIGEGAFCYCKSLESVTIPSSVTEIGDFAFGVCSNKMVMYVENNSYAQRYAMNNGYKYSVTSLVYPTKVSLSKSSLTLGVGESYSLNASVTPSNAVKDLTWTSNSSVLSVSNNGKLTAKKPGTATMTVKTSNGKTATCKVTVKPAATKVYLNKSTLTLGVGESYQLSSWCADGTYSAKRGFGSSNNSIVYTSGNGKLTAKKPGTATITVKTFNGKTATCKVTVKPAATKVYLNKSTLTLGVGESYQLSSWCADGTYSAKRGFGSSNNGIVYTSGNGKLTAKKPGTATITVKTFNGKTATCKVTVKPAATKVYLNKSTLTLRVGESYQLSSWCADGTYSAKRGFGSSNNGIVYTSGNGKLTAKKPGTATITVKTFNGKTATCRVTVV